MNNRLKKLIVTLSLVGIIIGGTSALSYAAGFWNYTPYTVTFFFTPEGCPWGVRLWCGETYALPPFQNGIPGSMSSNNAAGTVEIGSFSRRLLKDEEKNMVHYSWNSHEIEVGPQDYITFAFLEGNVIKMRIHRSDTGTDEYLELTFSEVWSHPER